MFCCFENDNINSTNVDVLVNQLAFQEPLISEARKPQLKVVIQVRGLVRNQPVSLSPCDDGLLCLLLYLVFSQSLSFFLRSLHLSSASLPLYRTHFTHFLTPAISQYLHHALPVTPLCTNPLTMY